MKKEPSLFSFFTGAENKPSTVDGVLSAFRDTIADLERVAEDHDAQAEAHQQVIADRILMRNAAEAEASRATTIAAKMKAVFQ